jgi:hypothetical protein
MVARESEIRPSGELTLRLLKRDQEPKRVLIKDIIRDGFPRPGLPREAFRWRLRNFAHLLIPAFKVAVINRLHIVAIQGSVYLKVIRNGVEIDLGLASLRVVTDAGVAYLTGDMNAAAGGNDISLFKYPRLRHRHRRGGCRRHRPGHGAHHRVRRQLDAAHRLAGQRDEHLHDGRHAIAGLRRHAGDYRARRLQRQQRGHAVGPLEVCGGQPRGRVRQPPGHLRGHLPERELMQ